MKKLSAIALTAIVISTSFIPTVSNAGVFGKGGGIFGNRVCVELGSDDRLYVDPSAKRARDCDGAMVSKRKFNKIRYANQR
jgi:hypothetical protein